MADLENCNNPSRTPQTPAVAADLKANAAQVQSDVSGALAPLSIPDYMYKNSDDFVLWLIDRNIPDNLISDLSPFLEYIDALPDDAKPIVFLRFVNHPDDGLLDILTDIVNKIHSGKSAEDFFEKEFNFRGSLKDQITERYQCAFHHYLSSYWLDEFLKNDRYLTIDRSISLLKQLKDCGNDEFREKYLRKLYEMFPKAFKKTYDFYSDDYDLNTMLYTSDGRCKRLIFLKDEDFEKQKDMLRCLSELTEQFGLNADYLGIIFLIAKRNKFFKVLYSSGPLDSTFINDEYQKSPIFQKLLEIVQNAGKGTSAEKDDTDNQ